MKKREYKTIICEACHKPMLLSARAKIGGQVFNFHGKCPSTGKKKKKDKRWGYSGNNGLFAKPRKPEIIAHHKMAIGGRDPF